jgi:nitroimidazol reductase NimA-like FMN-containing flavoprotein (pyridoxamine 5'-phosphate oxidase superfamily)
MKISTQNNEEPEDEPYLAAINYAYIDGHLYMHSAKEVTGYKF